FTQDIATLLWKDLLAELRTKEITISILVFALLTIVIFNFAFEPGPGRVGLIAPGVLWVAFSFSGVIGLNRTFVLEKERGGLQGLVLCPAEREALFLGKAAGTFIFMCIMEIIILPIFSILLNLPVFMPGLIAIAFLSNIGFVTMGTLFSAIAVNTRARDFVLPLLFFPVISPLLIFAVKSSYLVMSGGSWSDVLDWLWKIAAFDAIFLVLSTLIFEFVLEE
ncbi:MAG: heme exporter protein CcmB, partial [Candidatus Tectomicrobia bacterium]|nr:heme exporter protein CcmB [Candidatus Tectomicrobia bacterium]